MHAVIRSRIPEVRELCRKHGVRRLSVFGSAAGDGFDPGRSDIDVLVEFHPVPPVEHARNYLGLVEDLESMFGRRVDLVEPGPIRNPYLRQAIESSKLALYDAA